MIRQPFSRPGSLSLRFRPALTPVVIAIALCSAIGLAQSGSREPWVPMSTAVPPSSSDLISLGTGPLHAHGTLYGLGPNYRAIFAPDHVAFFAIGEDEPLMTWRVDEVAFEHGQRSLGFAATVEPTVDGNRITFDRGPFREVYDIRDDGLAQSFVFDELPEGSGDLIVRLHLDTTLEPTGDKFAETLGLAGTDRPSVSFGAITGIDDRGATTPGSMRCQDGILELRLPASFVASADLPLVLDPLIGLPFVIATPQLAARAGSPAYDFTHDRFIVTWEDSVPGDGIVVARFLSGNGSIVGPIFCLECDPSYDGRLVRAVGINDRDMFVVRMVDYFLASASAATGEVEIATAFPVSKLVRSDISGEATEAVDTMLRVFEDTTHSLTAERIRVDPDGTLTLAQSRQIVSVPATGSPLALLSVAKTGGRNGRTLVVWKIDNTLEAAIIDRGLNVLDRRAIVTTPVTKFQSQNDGDGRQWIVLYDTPSDTRAIPVFLNEAFGQLWTGNEVVVEPTSAPLTDIGWLGESCIVTIGVGGYPASAFQVLSMDPFTCRPCEGSMPTTASHKTLGTQRTGNPDAGDWALLTEAAAIGQRFRARDGVTTDLGGGCGDGGWAAATCALVGNQNFTLRLRDAAPGVPAFLAIGTQDLGFTCGPCRLVVDPVLIVPTGLTDPLHGCAEVSVPLANDPGLIGATFLMQWLSVNGNQCFGVEFSNALSVQVQ